MDDRPWQEIRPDPDGAPDDIVISCDSVHIERMADDAWWIGIYRGAGPNLTEVMLWLQVPRRGPRRIECSVTEDTIGCTDGSTPAARAARDPLYAMELVMREW